MDGEDGWNSSIEQILILIVKRCNDAEEEWI